MKTSRQYWSLQYVIPRVCLLWLVASFALSLFGPVRWYSNRPWDCLTVNPEARTVPGPFRPGSHWHSDSAFGDLASMSNDLYTRRYRSVDVTIDELGFHNPRFTRGAYNAILIGDSFAVGFEQNEDENLAAQLTAHTGLHVYNAATYQPLSAPQIFDVARRIDLHQGTVFLEIMDRWLMNPPPYFDEPASATARSALDRFQVETQTLWRDGAMKRISARVIADAYGTNALPNPNQNEAAAATLVNGSRLLFYPKDMEDGQPSAPDAWAHAIHHLQVRLAERNFNLVVLLVPSKYTVYQPLIAGAKQTNKEAEFRALQTALPDVPIVNPVEDLKRVAAERLAEGTLLFHPDDTHWNGDGIRTALDSPAAQRAWRSIRHTVALSSGRGDKSGS